MPSTPSQRPTRPSGRRSAAVLLLTVVTGVAGAGIALLALGTEPAHGGGAGANDVVVEPVPDAPGTPAAPRFAEGGKVEAVEAPFRRGDVAAASDGQPRTTGTIRGDVTLAASVVSRLDSITISVREAMGDDGDGRQPVHIVHPIRFDPQLGTPSFVIDEVPFSPYGYVVQAFAAGFNGTEQVARVDAGHPIADVVLGIHPGVPYSVLLRDQERAPLAGVMVTLVPEGAPLGRGSYQRVTDSFGAALFQDVLRGPYRVHCGIEGRPLLQEPPTIEVLSGGTHDLQSTTITVPRGQPLAIALYGPAGWGVAGVSVKLSASGRATTQELAMESDPSGRAVFPHVAPGTYWIHVHDQHWSPRTRQITIRADEPPPEVRIDLRRSR